MDYDRTDLIRVGDIVEMGGKLLAPTRWRVVGLTESTVKLQSLSGIVPVVQPREKVERLIKQGAWRNLQ